MYKPVGLEVERLAWLSRLNKVYLAYLRRVRSLEGELLREESRYGWFVGNTVEVVGALGGLTMLCSSLGGLLSMYQLI